MKALSIRHPWVEAILAGDKTIEIRSWATRHRGELLLHASRTWTKREKEAVEQLRALGLDAGRPAPERTGAILGKARLVDCRLMTDADWPQALLEPRSGRLWAWELAAAEPLPAPVPLAGERTLFEVDDALVSKAGRPKWS